MKHKCLTEKCNNETKTRFTLCKECSKRIENYTLNILRLYISEHYLYDENFMDQYPYKIVEIQRLKHGIRIEGYTNEFLKMFYHLEKDNCIKKDAILNSINLLKEKDKNLHDSLYHLWGRPENNYNCHKSTLYRRINNALKFIALNVGLLPVNNSIKQL